MISGNIAFAALAIFVVPYFESTQCAFAASDYYVSTNGSNYGGDGSKQHPWAQVGYAQRFAHAGDTVHVAAGIYYGSFDTYPSGTPSAYIVYQAESADFSAPVTCARVAADHGDLSTCVRLIGTTDVTWVNSGDYVAIRGFDITGGGLNGMATLANATQIVGNHVHDILRNSCDSNGGSGINLDGPDAELDGNYVHDIGPYPSPCGYIHGIYFTQSGGYAYNNISFNNSGFGIQLWHFPGNIALVNNTIFANATGGIVLGTDNDFLVDNVTVTNNLVVDNNGVGIEEQGWSAIVMGSHNVYSHNLVTGNADGSIHLFNGFLPLATILTAPRFVDYTGTASGNYRLTSGSAGINGATSAAPTKDFEGNARPQHGGYDVGAYQYLATQ